MSDVKRYRLFAGGLFVVDGIHATEERAPMFKDYILADDHARLRAQDREFTERLKDELIRMELWADTGVNTGEVDKQHIYLSRIRGRIRMLLTEWEKRNEQDA